MFQILGKVLVTFGSMAPGWKSAEMLPRDSILPDVHNQMTR